MARLNCTVVGAAAAFVQADATGFEPKADAAFIDPERRREVGGPGRGDEALRGGRRGAVSPLRARSWRRPAVGRPKSWRSSAP